MRFKKRIEQGQQAIEKLEMLVDAMDDRTFHLEKWIKQDSIQQALITEVKTALPVGKNG